MAQIPAAWRSDLLVTIDGAGASHEIIDHLTSLNNAAAHGERGRRVEFSIGWPVDERTRGGIGELREQDWAVALDAEGDPDPDAQVADATGKTSLARLSLACKPRPTGEHGRKELVTHADPGLAPWPPPGA